MVGAWMRRGEWRVKRPFGLLDWLQAVIIPGGNDLWAFKKEKTLSTIKSEAPTTVKIEELPACAPTMQDEVTQAFPKREPASSSSPQMTPTIFEDDD